MEKTRDNGYELQQERCHLAIKFFHSENNQSLEQAPQGYGTVPVTGGFQDAIG